MDYLLIGVCVCVCLISDRGAGPTESSGDVLGRVGPAETAAGPQVLDLRGLGPRVSVFVLWV